jgi:hypothetical protein
MALWGEGDLAALNALDCVRGIKAAVAALVPGRVGMADQSFSAHHP